MHVALETHYRTNGAKHHMFRAVRYEVKELTIDCKVHVHTIYEALLFVGCGAGQRMEFDRPAPSNLGGHQV